MRGQGLDVAGVAAVGEEAGGFEVGIVEEGIEAGTLLDPLIGVDVAVAVHIGREVAVPHDDGGGILLGEALQE